VPSFSPAATGSSDILVDKPSGSGLSGETLVGDLEDDDASDTIVTNATFDEIQRLAAQGEASGISVAVEIETTSKPIATAAPLRPPPVPAPRNVSADATLPPSDALRRLPDLADLAGLSASHAVPARPRPSNLTLALVGGGLGLVFVVIMFWIFFPASRTQATVATAPAAPAPAATEATTALPPAPVAAAPTPTPAPLPPAPRAQAPIRREGPTVNGQPRPEASNPGPTPVQPAPTPVQSAVPKRVAEVAAAFGELTVICMPACDDIRLDGVRIGESPIIRRRVVVGEHHLELQRLAQRETIVRRRTVHVTENHVEQVRESMTP
jgi:hypothetical protein